MTTQATPGVEDAAHHPIRPTIENMSRVSRLTEDPLLGAATEARRSQRRWRACPRCRPEPLAGLMDLVLHPRFSENKLVYFTYHKPSATAIPAAPARTWRHARHDHARARALGRRRARRDERHLLGDPHRQRLAHRVRQGRHGVHDGGLRRHAARQPRSRRRASPGSQQPCRQGPASARRWHGAAG